MSEDDLSAEVYIPPNINGDLYTPEEIEAFAVVDADQFIPIKEDLYSNESDFSTESVNSGDGAEIGDAEIGAQDIEDAPQTHSEYQENISSELTKGASNILGEDLEQDIPDTGDLTLYIGQQDSEHLSEFEVYIDGQQISGGPFTTEAADGEFEGFLIENVPSNAEEITVESIDGSRLIIDRVEWDGDTFEAELDLSSMSDMDDTPSEEYVHMHKSGELDFDSHDHMHVSELGVSDSGWTTTVEAADNSNMYAEQQDFDIASTAPVEVDFLEPVSNLIEPMGI